MIEPRSALWVALGLEATVAFGIPAITPGHDLMHDYISTAGATDQPHRVMFALAAVAGAMAHTVFVAALLGHARGRSEHAIVGLFGLFFMLLGIGMLLPCDPGCALETAPAMTHFVLGVLAFTLLGVAALLAVLVEVRANGLSPNAATVIPLGVIITDLALLAGDLTGAYRGLVERATVLAMMAWSLLMAARLPTARARAGAAA